MLPGSYKLAHVTGDVLSATKWSETRVSGGGGGGSGYTTSGTGHVYQAPVTISSTVTTRDQVFLRQPDGREHALDLAGFDGLACREGNTVTAVYAETPRSARSSRGWYFLVFNHATRQRHWNGRTMDYLVRPSRVARMGVYVLSWILVLQVFSWVQGYVGRMIGEYVAYGVFLSWIPALLVGKLLNRRWERARVAKLMEEAEGVLATVTTAGVRAAATR